MRATIKYAPKTRDPLPANGNLGLVAIKIVITEQCNLRCAYCPIERQTTLPSTPFSKALSKDKLNSIIEFVVANINSETVLSFYGGEPLYRFKDIERISHVIRARRPDWNGTVSLTSNMTVFSPKVAAFLSKNKAILFASIDGPRAVHDRNRISHTGRGTFSKVVENMKRLREFDLQYYQSRVGISCVVTTTDLTEVRTFATEFSDVACIRFSIAKNCGALTVDGAAIRDQLHDWAEDKLLSCSSLAQIERSPLLKDFIRNYPCAR